jgi:hypothetical protein
VCAGEPPEREVAMDQQPESDDDEYDDGREQDAVRQV